MAIYGGWKNLAARREARESSASCIMKQIYRRLPVIRELHEIRGALRSLLHLSKVREQIQREEFIRNLLSTERYADARRLNRSEHQVFSQNGEDGIIAEIFRRIGIQNKTFIEIGVGDGLENNTSYLLAQGWRGGWIEGNPDFLRTIRLQFREPLEAKRLSLVESFVTAENVAALVRQLAIAGEVDFLSIDIDRNTPYIWEALAEVRPRVLVIEYNATFPPDVIWKVPYRAEQTWNYTSHFGASLKALENDGKARGYALVGCDLSGSNAFFLREDQGLSKFAAPFTAENHYEPPRYWTGRNAHPPCFSD
jgi:hypothetical protein